MVHPKVSICIPTYNGERYLRECLESAISQSYRNVEIVVVDDKSEDNTTSIINAYQKENNNIRFYRNETNLGLVGNWNKCLEKSQGEWIKFLFQDDILYPDCIEKMINSSSGNASFIVCNRGFLISDDTPQRIREEMEFNGRERTLQYIHGVNTPQFIDKKSIAKIVAKYGHSNFIGEPTNVLFRKNIIGHIGMFDERLAQICDLEYWLRIATNFGLHYIPEELVLFRVHEQSTSAANRLYSIGWVDKIIIIHEFINDKYYQTLRQNISALTLIKFKEMVKIRTFELLLLLKGQPANIELRNYYNKIKATAPEISKYESFSIGTLFIYFFLLLRRGIHRLSFINNKRVIINSKS